MFGKIMDAMPWRKKDETIVKPKVHESIDVLSRRFGTSTSLTELVNNTKALAESHQNIIISENGTIIRLEHADLVTLLKNLEALRTERLPENTLDIIDALPAIKMIRDLVLQTLRENQHKKVKKVVTGNHTEVTIENLPDPERMTREQLMRRLIAPLLSTDEVYQTLSLMIQKGISTLPHTYRDRADINISVELKALETVMNATTKKGVEEALAGLTSAYGIRRKVKMDQKWKNEGLA